MEKFKVNCKNCVENGVSSDKIQVSLESDSGYSNYTVMYDGKIAFKCVSCGKYGSTDEYDNPNEIKNFQVRCLKCDEVDNWEFTIQDVDEMGDPTCIYCPKCDNTLTEDVD